MKDHATSPLTDAELAKAAELAPIAVVQTRAAFKAAAAAAERYRAAGYRSEGRLVRRVSRCGR